MPSFKPLLKSIEGDDLPQAIQAARYMLSVEPGSQFAVWVDSSLNDGITQAITDGHYTLSPHFRLLPLWARPGRRVLDLGAHIGTFSLYAASLGYEVVAVEASPFNTALLRASVMENGFATMRVVQAAISHQSGTLEFLVGGPYGYVKNAFNDSPTISVAALTVDELLSQVGWDTVDFIKMDIEGSEVKAVMGMPQLLSRDHAPVILFESNGHTLHLFGHTPTDLLTAIEAHRYRCYLAEPAGLIPIQAGDFQPGCVVDCFAVKQALPYPTYPVQPPLSYADVVSRILASASYPHPHIRAYIARALSQPNAEPYLDDPHVRRALRALCEDEEVDVRASAAWWLAQKAGGRPFYLSRYRRVARVLRTWYERIRRRLKR